MEMMCARGGNKRNMYAYGEWGEYLEIRMYNISYPNNNR